MDYKGKISWEKYMGVVTIPIVFIIVYAWIANIPLEANGEAVGLYQPTIKIVVQTRPGAIVEASAPNRSTYPKTAGDDGKVEISLMTSEAVMDDPVEVTITSKWKWVSKTIKIMVEPPEDPAYNLHPSY